MTRGVRALTLVCAVALVAGARAEPQAPLPDPDAFYRAVRENLVRAERANDRYVYRERRTDIHTNPFGKLGTGGVSVYEVYPSPVRQLDYRRLIERNGEPVPASERARQDREYRARAANVLRERAARVPDEERLVEEESARARARRQRTIDDVVATLAFEMRERTLYQGVSAIVIAFKPKPDARPDTRQGRLAQKFAGTVWIDERAAEVMRVEATSIDDISYGLGLVARLGEGTTATVTRAPVEGGVWMPSELTLKGQGRAVLFRRLVLDFSIGWFDYRPLPDDLLAPFLDPRVHGQPGRGPQ